ncbi:hypothetical protein [Tomitella biformata]|nr:hypothetical protein [Tomitella biformata]
MPSGLVSHLSRDHNRRRNSYLRVTVAPWTKPVHREKLTSALKEAVKIF